MERERRLNRNLRGRRGALGWSLRTAAKQISRRCQGQVALSANTYARWERGEHAPSLAYVPGLLGAFGVSRVEDVGYTFDGDHGRLRLLPDAHLPSQTQRAQPDAPGPNLQLRRRREGRVWSIRQAAAEITRRCDEPLTLAPDTYASWEQGKHAPSLAYLPGLLSAFDARCIEELGYTFDPDRGRLLPLPHADPAVTLVAEPQPKIGHDPATAGRDDKQAPAVAVLAESRGRAGGWQGGRPGVDRSRRAGEG